MTVENTVENHASLLSSIKGLTHDSRAVKGGFLFAAFPGVKVDGRDYIPAAIKNGACAVLVPTGTSLPDQAGADVTLITDDNPRQLFAYLTAAFYKNQPEHIVAVTGTNGKTSIVHFVSQIWSALGFNAASIGTLQGGMTTADPVSLHQSLKTLFDDGMTHVAMEASSHGLDQYRLDGVKLHAAGFTNLSRDHLDYHADMDAYLAAKTRLFTQVLSPDGIAVINVDDEVGQRIVDIMHAQDMPRKIWTYGYAGEDLTLKSVTPQASGQRVICEVLGDEYTINVPLVGEFQIMNILCALGLVLAQAKTAGVDLDMQKAVEAIESINGAPGRLQLIEGPKAGCAVFVDYAHTPDALEHVLKALRPHIHVQTQSQSQSKDKARLLCLFGCGGDRDTGKRPQMGAIANALADQVIVTDDNPRSEDPEIIRQSIVQSVDANKLIEIPGRRDAIRQTVNQMQAGDILLVAGKGHEQGQIFKDHTEHFDDVEEVVAAIHAAGVTQCESVNEITNSTKTV